MPLVPTPKNCDPSVKKAIQILTQKLGLKSVPNFASVTLTDLTVSSLVGTNADKLMESVTVGTGLDYTRPTLSLSHLGIEALTDPGADRIFFWDNNTTAAGWLVVGNSIVITTTTIDTIQDIQTSASPTFTGLTLSGLTQGSVVFAGASGVISQDNSNLFWDDTNKRVGIGTTTPNAPLEVKGAKPGVVGGFQSGQLQVTGSGGEFYCAVITGHNALNGNTQLWYLGNTSSSSHNDIAFINRQNAPIHFYTNNTSRVTIGAAGNVTLAIIAAEGSDVDKFLVSSTGEIKYRTGTQVLSDIGGSASGHNHSGIYEPADAGLTSLAGLVYASDSFIKVTATDTYAIRTIVETKTDLSLNLVENTALSTWVGSANITTLGTIATVGNITIADGGTIGQAAGPLLTFNDTSNYLVLTGANLGIHAAVADRGVTVEGANANDSSIKLLNTQASSTFAGSGLICYNGDSTAMTSGHRFGYILFGGSRDASNNLVNACGIMGFASQNWVDGSAYGSEFRFETIANGATARTVRMTIANDGGIFIYNLKAGANQAAAGAAANELWVTSGHASQEDNTVMIGV